MTEDEMKNLKSLLAPIESAILLNTVYTYLAWSKPFDTDPQTFQAAYEVLLKQSQAMHEQALRSIWGQEEKNK